MDHIRIADLVVINKTDLVNPNRLSALKQQVEAIAARSRIWETSYGKVPLDLLFDGQVSGAFADIQNKSPVRTDHGVDHNSMFATWTYRSDAEWSFGALHRAVDKLPREIYRAKGIVRLDLATDDYGIFQLTGKRSWLKLTAPDSADEAKAVTTELVFIGKLNGITDEGIGALFDQALAEANAPGDTGYIVKDLRAFHVIFA